MKTFLRYFVKLHIIAENGTNLIDKRPIECYPVPALCRILHVLVLTIDGASQLVLIKLRLEINPSVTGSEIIEKRA